MYNNYNKIEATIDNDEIYQKNGLGRKIFNRLIWFPLVGYLPKKLGHWLFTKTNEHTNQVAKHAKTYQALELVYSYNGFKLNGNGIIDSFFNWFWEEGLLNGHAARNRFKMVKKELTRLITKKHATQNCGNNKIRILSLASGSARAVIETLAELKYPNVEARFVDISRNALNYSKQLAEDNKVSDQTHCFRANVLDVPTFCENWPPDIVEVVGLMDYLDDETAVDLIANIYHHLKSDGYLIISNIVDNPEKRFFTEIVNWEMIYRSPDRLRKLVSSSGFDQVDVICEPLKIHTVCLAAKPAQ